MFVTISRDQNEAMTQSIGRVFPEHTIKLDLNTVINRTNIDDEIIAGEPLIHWKTDAGLEIKNLRAYTLVNRVDYLPKELFLDFHPEDQDYAYYEWYAYLSFALSSFTNATSKPSHAGLSGSTIPLPMQWKKIKKAFKKELPVPQYYYGSLEHCPFSLKDPDLVSGDLYNLYHWKPGFGSQDKDKRYFLYKRPKGTPVICLTVGKEVLFSDSQSLTKTEQNILRTYALKVSEIFSFQISETLFFIDKDEVSFAMMNNYLGNQWREDDLDLLVYNGLKPYLKGERQ